MATEIVSLLPARNAAADLLAHLDSVARFADAVVALDDGSTDDTRAILEAHPLVHTVLTNPRRDGYAGWDDHANRQRLLEAALELEPRWVMSLDADERMSPDDADALHAFAVGEADVGCAYLLRSYRMVEDLQHYDDHPPNWRGRLFAPAPGHVFPSGRLHFVPIPTVIGRDRWVHTTLRIQNLAAMTPELRAARFDKYLEADPECEWAPSYANLLNEPGRVRRWYPRGAHLPVVANGRSGESPLAPDEPAVSVVVISRDDEAIIERAVGAVVRQELDEPFEVILVTSGTDRTAAIVRERFPSVQVVELDEPALPGGARNAGLRVARGRYVSFSGSHVELMPGCLAARLRAHRLGWAMVTGTMVNGTRTWAGWATYFLENSSVLPGRPSFVFESPPMRCSYVRDAVAELGGFPEDMRAGEDTAVNRELFGQGYGSYREATVVSTHHSPCRQPGRLLVHHFQRGRALGRIMVGNGDFNPPRARALANHAVAAVPRRMRFVHGCVRRWGRGVRAQYYLALPLIATACVAALLGTWWEVALRPRSRRAPVTR